MKDNKKLLDLMWMMAAAGWSRSDILAVTECMRDVPFSEINELITQAKSAQQHFQSSFRHGRRDFYFDRPAQKFPSNDVVKKVVHLLRGEAGLTTMDAINLVSKGLRKIDHVRAAGLPGYSKQSLSQWAERATQLFSPSELLYVATTVRNATVHGSALDWNLRKNEP